MSQVNAAIAALVPPGSRVLDLGCGRGELLAHLIAVHGCSGYGVEIDDTNLQACVESGVDVIQLNLEDGLAMFADHSFDVVLQLQTLQHLKNTETMLRETARVGRMGIVSFPNFALAQPAVGAARSHARHAGPALPVVRHPQHPGLDLRRLRCAGPAQRPACDAAFWLAGRPPG